ncbi:MAG: hypothetical protein HW391_1490 [Chloroflexi bacterium]|nr:hypothetical protein [Chloroflexota bacterium]
MTFEEVAGWSALLAAAATVVGMVTLMVFFARGDPWGRWNDIASVVLMLATIPVALLVAAIEAEQFPIHAYLVACAGIVGMVLSAGFQTALVLRIRTYEQLLGRTLASGAIVGLWYVLIGVLSLPRGLGVPLPQLAVAAGIGFVAVAYGFAVGNQHHMASKVGGVVLFVASTAFLTMLGLQLLSGDLVIPTWNA